jgi:group II intron reverse transcriptase/maturase
MRNAETLLAVIRDRGSRGLPLERVYRLLFRRDLFLLAYGRIATNQGAMPPGVTPETADGMALAKIDAIIEALRLERYRWTPARRVYIPKTSGRRRPLGLPTWSDKLVQEVIRLILEAYYDPQFSAHSHGFRPRRGCHTALMAVYRTWHGTTWLIEGDIAQYFDRLDHQVLLGILAERVHDGRFLALIGGLLRAGYLEDWRFNATLSGTPQGGVASPILANIYLDRFDQWVERTLLPAYNRGDRRRSNPTYTWLTHRARDRKKAGDHAAAKDLRRQAQRLPAGDPTDPAYRRLSYVRYADDFLLGFVGPRVEAEAIKRLIQQFLRDTLHLELSDEKTLITHARTSAARFLGYEVSVLADDTARDRHGRRCINGAIGLRVPADVVHNQCAPYLANGAPIHRPAWLHDSAYSIMERYQAIYRGVVNYYRLAFNLHRFDRLKWALEGSLAKTLAAKQRISVNQVYERYGATVSTPHGPYKVLQVTVEREGKPPLVGQWGGIPLRRNLDVVLDDQPTPVWNTRSELEQRLLADMCELCGSRENVEVHHIRALKDLTRHGRADRPEWVQAMAIRQRKTLVVCRACHRGIHQGRPGRQDNTERGHRKAGSIER